MPRTIQQSIALPATADRLFDMYLDPASHEAITGAPVTISPEPGSEFRAFNGSLSGKMLYTAPHTSSYNRGGPVIGVRRTSTLF